MITLDTEIAYGNKPQYQMFISIKPIVERTFYDGTAWFNGFNTVIFYLAPDEKKLDSLVDRLNHLAVKQKSIIKFGVWAEDTGGAVPVGIYAYFEEEELEQKMHISVRSFECIHAKDLPWNK